MRLIAKAHAPKETDVRLGGNPFPPKAETCWWTKPLQAGGGESVACVSVSMSVRVGVGRLVCLRARVRVDERARVSLCPAGWLICRVDHV